MCWSTLQMNVNTYMDSDINKKIRDAPNGIKQVCLIQYEVMSLNL